MQLLTLKQYKLDKALARGFYTPGLTLSPAHELSQILGGTFPSCCAYSGDCEKVCLVVTGFNSYPTHAIIRAERTRFFWKQRNQFIAQLLKELDQQLLRATRKGLKFAARLNLLSDLEVLPELVAAARPNMLLYDYTKVPPRYWKQIPNYHRTYSVSEKTTAREVQECIDQNINLAVVFNLQNDAALPKTTTLHGHRFQVFDADLDDCRWFDTYRTSRIAGLRFKGSKANMDTVAGSFIKVTTVF